MRALIALLLLLALGNAARAAAPPAPVAPVPATSAPPAALLPFLAVSAPVVALRHVRVIDGTGAAAREDQTLVLRDGRIAAVGDDTRVRVPSGAQELNLAGRTVLPGLVGMHDHLFYPAGGGMFTEMARSFPRLYLAAGVTTIRTTGSVEPFADLNLAHAIASGEAVGPHIFVTGPYLEGSAAGTLQLTRLATPAEAVATVDYWLDRGVHDFKAYNYLTRATLAAAIEQAHRRGAKVTGHLCSIGFHEAIDLGIDNLEHGLIVDTEFLPGKKADECPEGAAFEAALAAVATLSVDGPEIRGLIRDLVANHVAVTSTLPVFEMFVPGRAPLQKRVLDALSTEARAAFLANRVALTLPRLDANGKPVRVPWPELFALEQQFERRFVAAGGLLLAGLDPTGIGGVVAGYGDQRELELLVEAGFTPLEAIHVATANGAQYLGELDRIGTIAAGKQADLVVVKGDPSRQIEDVENVEIVFREGRGYDPAKLVESVRGLVGIR